MSAKNGTTTTNTDAHTHPHAWHVRQNERPQGSQTHVTYEGASVAGSTNVNKKATGRQHKRQKGDAMAMHSLTQMDGWLHTNGERGRETHRCDRRQDGWTHEL
mmetsp:Transcript_44369/g.110463  ORF Transcript_44369/g.110463 Transcript_44369/m.110463 type:complete len:103 (-) Transcript_44369:140-448(-)